MTTPAGDEVERAIGELDRGDRDAAPAAGNGRRRRRLAAGRLSRRAHRRSPGHGRGAAQQQRRAAARRRRQHRHRQRRRLGVPARKRTLERGLRRRGRSARQSGLVAPTGPASGTIRVDPCRPWARSTRPTAPGHRRHGADPADLPGLTTCRRRPSTSGTVPASNFSYTLHHRRRAQHRRHEHPLSPVNDARWRRPGSASGNGTAARRSASRAPTSTAASSASPSPPCPRAARSGSPTASRRSRSARRSRPSRPRRCSTVRAPISTGDQTILTFTVNGGATSAPAAVPLTVVSVNDLPQAAGSAAAATRTRRSPCTWAASMSTAAWSR